MGKMWEIIIIIIIIMHVQILCMHAVVNTKLMISHVNPLLSFSSHRHVWHSQEHFILDLRSRWHWYSWLKAPTENCVGETEREIERDMGFPFDSITDTFPKCYTPTLISQKQNSHVKHTPMPDTDGFRENMAGQGPKHLIQRQTVDT